MSALARSGFNVAANGIRQHVLRYGHRGQPLVIVPGITSPAITWEFVAEALAGQCDTYVVDVRGRGLSSSEPELDYGVDAMADDLTGLLDALKLDNAIVLGHSMGARIAARAASKQPARMARLILVDPPVSGPGRRAYPSKLPWYTDSIRLATAGIDADGMRSFCPTWTEEQLALRAEWLHTCYEPAIVKAFNDFHETSFHDDVPGLKLPTALMVAGKGGVIQSEDIAELSSLNDKLQIVHVPDAGHMIPWDDFPGFLGAVDSILGTSLRKAS
ncbi:alpha/beta hydrolase [Rhodopseudomonas boonkerdii]|uniref:alpha/beta fold hydrolase n=1 Tax=Rhodopseudomonas boonkerdii TaxID=475937 RepID=UPI001E42790C|nr:alpha/beta hydrolase [Rhodopseudomonas boonkerdii]UGV24712.1 alpha/beta hydrolase [Rhodopseudomonas boonkerdii]